MALRPSCSHRAAPDDHHAFHEDAKPGDLPGQFPTRSFNSSKKFWTRMSSELVSSSARNITNRLSSGLTS